jgi:hypothetical protein
MLCPYTSPQNGKADCMIHTINNVICSLLFQASLPARYWAENLYTVTYILNLLPTNTISAPTPYFALSCTTPSYAHLQVFGCACYPNTSTTAPQKLAPHSCRCVFLGYSSDYKGYRCLDLTTNHLLISRHVVFDESSFPFASSDPPPDDLDSLFSSSPAVCPIAPPYPSSIAGTSEPVVTPHPAPTPPPEPCMAPARTTHGPDVFVCATRGLSFTLHQAPPGVPATASNPCVRALSRQVVGLPPHRRGS